MKLLCECIVDEHGVRFWCDECIPDEYIRDEL